MGLPQAFQQRIEQLFSQAEGKQLIASLAEPPVKGLRINPLKTTIQELQSFFPGQLTAVPWAEWGYYYEESLPVGKHPFHHAGLYYIQEPSAMAVAHAVAPQPGEKVLDLCAAPGGKSTHLATLMNGEGILVVNEYSPKRAKVLVENLERFGITNALITNERAEHLAQHFPAYFDRILVDAPCSGEGMFRKDEEAINTWSVDKIARLIPIQASLLAAAYTMLRPGGILVYSTCTFAPEENEQQIEQLLQRYPDLKLLQLQHVYGMEGGRSEWTKTGCRELEKALHLWPHRLRGEGHFIAKLQKEKKTEAPPSRTSQRSVRSKLKQQQFTPFLTFYQEKFHHSWLKEGGELLQVGAHLYWLPAGMPDFSGLRLLRAGLYLGYQKGKLFHPSHALALATPRAMATAQMDMSVDDPALQCYLKGETLPGTGNRGWLLISVEGRPLGWGKESQQQVKNHYPKGLRIKGI